MNKKKTIIKKNYCKIIIEKDKVTKIYDNKNYKHENFKKFINELSIYLMAKELKLDFIPKLLSYNILERKIVTKNEGISLKELCEIKNCKKKDFLPHILVIYNKLKDLGFYHNDLKWRNVIYNEKKDKYFLIDFEITSPKYEDSEKQSLIHKINKLNFNEKYNSKDYISKKKKKTKKKNKTKKYK